MVATTAQGCPANLLWSLGIHAWMTPDLRLGSTWALMRIISGMLQTLTKGFSASSLCSTNIWTQRRAHQPQWGCCLRVTATHLWSGPDALAAPAAYQELDPAAPGFDGGGRGVGGVGAGLVARGCHPGRSTGLGTARPLSPHGGPEAEVPGASPAVWRPFSCWWLHTHPTLPSSHPWPCTAPSSYLPPCSKPPPCPGSRS